MTVQKNIYADLKDAKKRLKEKGIAEFEIDAEYLLSATLKISRLKLALFREKNLTQKELIIFESYIQRRLKREPVDYILGRKNFMGLEFRIDKNVLIPRPETEILVEIILEKYKQENDLSVLDLCCGSGCAAVSLKVLGNFKNVTASDISLNALVLAKKNALLNNADVRFIESDLFENLNELKFDLIVSNPPYISRKEYQSIEPELKYEPKIALTDNKDGLSFYRKISAAAKNYLNGNGSIYVELNAVKAGEISSIFESEKYKDIEIINDYASLPRILKAVF
jgi:release factor glutamine methyltransferase